MGHQISEWLDSFSYMPGWTFTWYGGHPEGDQILISFTVPNSREPGSVQSQNVWTFVPPCNGPYQFYRWLRWRLHRLAIHEVDEFFKVNEEIVFDPHRDMEEQHKVIIPDMPKVEDPDSDYYFEPPVERMAHDIRRADVHWEHGISIGGPGYYDDPSAYT
jgi:hypothetical protein